MNDKILRLPLVKFLIIFVLCLFASCNNEKETELSPEASETSIKVIEEGQEVYSQLLCDDKVIEEVIDDVVNFGDENFEMLFHVNKSHKVNGEDVPPGPADIDCTYYSLTREEIEGFIRLFAVMKGIAETDQLTDEQKRKAFEELFYLLKESDIELALLVYLSNGSLNELTALDKIVSQRPKRSAYSSSNLNTLFESMVRAEMRPSELLEKLDSQNLTFVQFVNNAETTGINLYQMIQTRAGENGKVKTVVNGEVLSSKLTLPFVEKAKPVSNIESVYASLLHEDDLNLSNYYKSEKFISKSYEMRYGTKLTPMAQCVFKIETDFCAENDKFPHWNFVSRIGIVVEKVRRTAGMHVEGKITFGTPTMSEFIFGGYNASSENEVIVDYGDALCFSRHGRLKFWVDSFSGYQQYGTQTKW